MRRDGITIETVAQYCDRDATRGQCRAMGQCIDAIGQTTDGDDSGRDEFRDEAFDDLGAVRRGLPRADDSYEWLPGPFGQRPSCIENDGWVGDLPESRWIAVVGIGERYDRMLGEILPGLFE